MNEDPQALLARTANGDRSAFKELARRWDRTIMNLALRMTGHLEDARDVRQQALMRIHASAGQFNGRCSVDTWIYRIVVNLCRDAQRRQAAQLRLLAGLDEIRRDGHALDPQASTARSFQDSVELGRVVARAVHNLPQSQREVVILRHFHELSFQEIAQILEVPPTTVRSRMLATLKSLRQSLNEPERTSPHAARKRDEQ